MIDKLKLKNFTVFRDAEIEFVPGLNVVIGENGTGKTHLLKLSYIFVNAYHDLINEVHRDSSSIERYIYDRFDRVFMYDKVSSLLSAGCDQKGSVFAVVSECLPEVESKPAGWEILLENNKLVLSHECIKEQSFNHISPPKRRKYGKGCFLPSKEILSIFEGFIHALIYREFQFDDTYKDLAIKLAANKLKNPPAFLENDLQLLRADVGGVLRKEGEKFYLDNFEGRQREITLEAEGVRKIATLMHLLENGGLEEGDTLIWDEPESNMNPRLLKDIAVALFYLAKNRIQVIVATHSYFLLKEIDLLSRRLEAPPELKFIGLSKSANGVQVEQVRQLHELTTIVSLDEELALYDREQELFYAKKDK